MSTYLWLLLALVGAGANTYKKAPALLAQPGA